MDVILFIFLKRKFLNYLELRQVINFSDDYNISLPIKLSQKFV